MKPNRYDYLVQQMRGTLSEVIESETDLLAWTKKYRLINGLPPELPPSQVAMYQDLSPEVVVMKGTQIFISEYLVNLSLWALDTKFGSRGNILYTMPTQLQMDDFAQSRIDKAIEDSTYLRRRFEKAFLAKQVNRTRLKRIGGSSLHLRGSDSLKQLISVDADIVINDEVDWFTEDTVAWSKERLGSAKHPLFRAVSKPTYPGYGIHLMYQNSDQRHWQIKCEHCNRWQVLDWEHNIVFDVDNETSSAYNIQCLCAHCKQTLNRLSANGEWVADFPGRQVHGYHLPRLISPLANLKKMAEDSLNITDIPKIQSFYNSGLGLAYAPKGGHLSESELRFSSEYPFEPATSGYGGVDVGLKLHACVIQYTEDGLVVCQAEEFDDFSELDIWFKRNNLRLVVIDARGDPRATLEWTSKYPGRVYRWSHIENMNDVRYSEDTQEVKLNRTVLLDTMYSKIRDGQLVFPITIRQVPGFISHMRALVRELVKDQRLNRLIPRYVGAAADHYAFALAYSVLAAAHDNTSPPPRLTGRGDLVSAGQRSGMSTSSWTGSGSPRGWRVR